MAAREAMQTGDCVNALPKTTPRRASRSRCGVCTMLLAHEAEGVRAVLVGHDEHDVRPGLRAHGRGSILALRSGFSRENAGRWGACAIGSHER